jgi:4'-phosphopantetheinyl transferase
VWYAWTERCCTPARLAWYQSLLSGDERLRLDRFAFEHLKHEYLLTRALCRTTLSRYADVLPAAWSFRANTYGRPQIVDCEASLSLRFNLSNARTLVACIVARDIEVGVDVEEVDRGGEVLNLADHYFSDFELRALRALPSSQQNRRFFELWTLKESYIKARGMGLSIPLDQFSIALDAVPAADMQRPISVSFSARIADTANDWQFRLFAPSDRHLMAVSLRRGDVPHLRVRVMETIPGADVV